MAEISVVIPVYNVEKYLEQCLDSLVNQTFSDIELILVDDGSTDSSLVIEEKYAKKDKRIQVIKKSHSNAGDARNIGMDIAKGKYITFLDSDDWYELDMLELKYNEAEAWQADICACDADLYHTDTGEYERVEYILKKRYLPVRRPFSIEDVPDYIFQVIGTAPWTCLYNRQFILKHQLRYQSQVRANDVFFSNMALALAERITVVDEMLVHHRVGMTTNLQSGLAETPNIYLETDLIWKRELEKQGIYQKCRNSFVNYVLGNVGKSLRIEDENAVEKVNKRIEEGILAELDVYDCWLEWMQSYLVNPEKEKDRRFMWTMEKIIDLEMPKEIKPKVELMMEKLSEQEQGLDISAKEINIVSLFPFEFIPKGSKVILYGLGDIGRKYIKQIIVSKWCTIVGVSDRDREKNESCYPFISLAEIKDVSDYDYVIIAIGLPAYAHEVYMELLTQGIPREKIFWVGEWR